MKVALELPPRQAARVIEQALRQNQEFQLEFCRGGETFDMTGTFFERAGELIGLEIKQRPDEVNPPELIGMYFDGRMTLADQLYMFTASVIDCSDENPNRILVSNPEALTVINRRRFERTNATIAAQARFFFGQSTTGYLGLLASVSGSGLAANLPDDSCDAKALVGDPVRVRFELPGFEGDFELPGEICSKSIEPETKQMQLGVEFEIQDDLSAADDLVRLRSCLAEMTINLTEE